jgi:purine-binding chemotaxis protein CheW
MSEELAYCTFELDGLFFGVQVLAVQEVIRYQRMTSVPLAPEVVRGLINLRGQVVTAIDLRCRLGMAPLPDGRLPMNVVVRTADGPVSLLVDSIGDVIEVDDDTFEPPPDTLTGVAAELITGVYKLEGRLLLVLDIDKALRLPTLAGAESGS